MPTSPIFCLFHCPTRRVLFFFALCFSHPHPLSKAIAKMLDGNPRGDLVIRVTIVCGVLETLAVSLRLVARWRSKASFAADDWWIVATLIPSYAMLAVGCLMVTIGGGGRHADTLDRYQIETFLKVWPLYTWFDVSEASLTDLSDCHWRPDCLCAHNCHGQDLHFTDVSSHLRHRGVQEGHVGRRHGMRRMGYSSSPLPHIPMPPFFWALEPGGHFHE